MKIDRNQLLSVLSEALDCVEKEVFGITDRHGKRVAWLCTQMGKKAGMTKEEISDTAVAALLHDNALNEFKMDYENGKLRSGSTGERHCTAGEENLKLIAEDWNLRGFILYHHECADGSGPFGKTAEEVPLGAELVHIADELDLKFSFGKVYENAKNGNSNTEDNHLVELEEKRKEIRSYIKQEEGKKFSSQATELFLSILTSEIFAKLSDKNIDSLTLDAMSIPMNATRGIAELFARIIDYKSPFTRTHSTGVAQKAEQMAKRYGYDDKRTEKLYIAGALHDIGKLFVDIEVLEKRGRLDEQEYKHIQSHAYETYRLLSKIEGMEEIREWAAYHHEKLNGKGYPFGLTAEEMTEEMRLLACLDIYQALTEDRPYKAGMSHGKAIGILYELAEKGELDSKIVTDMEQEFLVGKEEEQTERTALFQCPVCGYIYEGDVVPTGYVCPVCGQPEHRFYRV